jgi:hypothetical protein
MTQAGKKRRFAASHQGGRQLRGLSQLSVVPRRIFVAASVVLGLSCAPQATPTTPDSSQANQAAADGVVAPEVAPLTPLDPVPTPEGVVARFRIRNPQKLADGVLDAASIPFDLSTAIASIQGQYAFLKAIDRNGPIEGAVVLNPEDPLNPSRFLSVGVSAVEDVLRLLESSNIDSQEGPLGVHHFLLGRDPCAVGRSIGISPARVVCSDRTGGLDEVLSYALRGFPNEQLGQADIYTQVDFKPIRNRYEKELDRLRLLASVFARQGHVGHAKLDRAMTDAAIGFADEISRLALESDQVIVELNEREGSLAMTMRATFDGQASTTVQNLRSQAGAQAPAPPAFRNLPSTTASALYLRELSAASVEGWTSIFVDLLSGYAEYRGASAEFAARLGRVVRVLGPAGRVHVQASGPMVSTTEQGRPMARAAWTLWGVTQPKSEVTAFLDDMAALLASSDWEKVVESKELRGKLKRSKKALKGAAGAAVYEWAISDPALEALKRDLPGAAGSSASDAMKTAEQLSHGFLAVHEIDGMSYVSSTSGANTAPLSEAYRALSDLTVPRLHEVSSLEPLLQQPAVAAGFLTLLGSGSDLWSFAPDQIVRDLSGILNSTPHRGLVPMNFVYRADAGQVTEAELSVTIPREFTQDAATLAAILATELSLK